MNKYTNLLRELFLYGMIGLFSASMDTASFCLFRNIQMQLLIANFLSVNIGICISFFLNTYLNFRKTDELKNRAVKFFTIGYFGLAISAFIMWLGTGVLDKNEFVVKIASVFVVAGIQYILNKLITFRK